MCWQKRVKNCIYTVNNCKNVVTWKMATWIWPQKVTVQGKSLIAHNHIWQIGWWCARQWFRTRHWQVSTFQILTKGRIWKCSFTLTSGTTHVNQNEFVLNVNIIIKMHHWEILDTHNPDLKFKTHVFVIPAVILISYTVAPHHIIWLPYCIYTFVPVSVNYSLMKAAVGSVWL